MAKERPVRETFKYVVDSGVGYIKGNHTMSGVLELPYNMTRIEADAVAGSGAHMVVIWDNCEFVGPRAFAGVELWELAVGSNNMEIDPKAFESIPFVYVICAPNSTIWQFAQARGWATGDSTDFD